MRRSDRCSSRRVRVKQQEKLVHDHRSPTGSAPAASGPSAQATGASIKVGFICTCSGVLGTFNAPLIDVFRAWADTVNASGGIDGHNVDVIYENDAGVPGTSETEVQTLIADHVVAITDSSVVDQPWASTVQAANIPVVGMGQTSDSTFDTNPDFYPAGQTFSSQMYAITAEAKAAGATNIGDIYCAEAPACQQTASLIKSAGQQLGVPETYKAAISSTTPNYTAQCIAASQQHLTSFFVADAVTVLDEVPATVPRKALTRSTPGGLPLRPGPDDRPGFPARSLDGVRQLSVLRLEPGYHGHQRRSGQVLSRPGREYDPMV